MFYAHSTSDASKADWQPLPDHLQAVSRLAAEFARPFGSAPAAALVGLMHDLGKYCQAFQRRLEGAPQSVDHATAGAQILSALAGPKPSADKTIASILAYAVAGHHGGLPDYLDGDSGLQARLKKELANPPDPVWRTNLSPQASGLLPSWMGRDTTPHQCAFWVRMIYSCLVDADYKDTEAFCAGENGIHRDRCWPSLQTLLPDLVQRFDQAMAVKSADTDKPLTRLRGTILSHVRQRGRDLPPGLFTLTVPTGGGKTLASLGFALDHAAKTGQQRIIYAIPYTAIIEQTADIFRNVLGDDVVLEHHSALDDQSGPKEKRGDFRDKLRLAMEDWAAPVIVTTTVQLFESLFSNRPARCRKLHHLAGSIIILDEAQTLPLSLLQPALWAVNELALHYGVSVVFCTATQPALNETVLPGLLKREELAPDPDQLATSLRRVTIHKPQEMTDAALLSALAQREQGLVIVNSRGHALDLFRNGLQAGLDGLVHLTTRQTAADRRQILAGVRTRLQQSLPCRLIATSLIECGVDVSFPVVWRAESGLDQIAQAAGRCNREGHAEAAESPVFVFRSPDHPVPQAMRKRADDFTTIAPRHDDLLSLAAIDDYFRQVYWHEGKGLDEQKILTRAFKADRSGFDFAYRTVAEAFQMIDSPMLPVVIPGPSAATEALNGLSGGWLTAAAAARRLQTHLVQVPRKAYGQLLANGHVRLHEPDRYGVSISVQF